jgi:hypothetical protein
MLEDLDQIHPKRAADWKVSHFSFLRIVSKHRWQQGRLRAVSGLPTAGNWSLAQSL